MANRAGESVIALILAGGSGARLEPLSSLRAVASIPFAGKYRIIDFALSNCANSGLSDVMVLTQYRPLSLHDHIGNGTPWDLDRLRGGVRVISPYTGRAESGWDRGTADAVYQNVGELDESPASLALVLYGDHIYKMDYRPMIARHRQTGADVTVGVVRKSLAEASRYGVVTTDAHGRITDFQEKPAQPTSDLISMGIYVFSKAGLIERVRADAAAEDSQHDFGRNIIPGMIRGGDKVYAYEFGGYWQDVGTVASYWKANMDLLEPSSKLALYNRDWVVYTRSEERPPAKVGIGARLDRSLISNGCQVRGKVIHSVLSPGVIIEEGAVVSNSVIMTDTVIGAGCIIERAIIDKEVRIGAGCVIGRGDGAVDESGITLIGKRAIIAEGTTIGRGVQVAPGVTPDDFASRDVADGAHVGGEVAAR